VTAAVEDPLIREYLAQIKGAGAEDYGTVQDLVAAQAIAAQYEAMRVERDLAVAHDRQPYPTADAYEAACAALHKHRARADAAEAGRDRLAGQLRNAMEEAAAAMEQRDRLAEQARRVRECLLQGGQNAATVRREAIALVLDDGGVS
jgi:uncharacterized coiled-coil DUF342 family protein